MQHATEVPDRQRLRKFTVEDFHLMAEKGIFAPDERVELIAGVVQTMSPKNRAHSLALYHVVEFLRKELRGRASVYQEVPLRLATHDSEPEPDVLLCSNPDVDAYGTASTEPVMVIEISDSSLARDLGEKARLYARAGIPEYWVVNLVDRTIVSFRGPAEAGYTERSEAQSGSVVSPSAWPDVALEVSSVFPEADSDDKP